MKNTTYFLIVVTIIMTSCKATVESENNRWQDNIAKLKGVQEKYPNVKSFLKNDLIKAQDLKAIAEAESNEEIKIKKLKAANSVLKSKLLAQINKYEKSILNIKNNTRTINEKYGDERYSERVVSIFNDVDIVTNNSIRESSQIFNNRNEAISSFTKINTNLLRVENRLKSYVSERKKAEIAKRKKEKEKTAPISNQENATESEQDAPTMKSCNYCKVQSDASSAKCSSCGAPF